MYCPDNIFKLLSNASDGYAYEKECISFAYEVLADNIVFTNKCLIFFPKFTPEIFDDWIKFEYWLEDITIPLQIEDMLGAEFDYFGDDSPPPRAIFKDQQTLIQLVLEKLCDPAHDEAKVEIEAGYVEITNRNDTLFLIFTDYTAWGLGHADRILVVKSLSYLNEDNDFYELDFNE